MKPISDLISPTYQSDWPQTNYTNIHQNYSPPIDIDKQIELKALELERVISQVTYRPNFSYQRAKQLILEIFNPEMLNYVTSLLKVNNNKQFRLKLISWLINFFPTIDKKYNSASTIMQQFVDLQLEEFRPKQCTSPEAMFRRQFQNQFTNESKTTTLPNNYFTKDIINLVIPIDPQRMNRACIIKEQDDYLYDLDEYEPRAQKQPDFWHDNTMSMRNWY